MKKPESIDVLVARDKGKPMFGSDDAFLRAMKAFFRI